MRSWLRIGAAVILAAGSLIIPIGATAGPAVHLETSSLSERARSEFDRGLLGLLAYNRRAAVAHFQAALNADPAFAMALWGLGAARGPNLNVRASQEELAAALDATSRAARAAAASPLERRLIAALGVRYARNPQGAVDVDDVAYARALAALATNARSATLACLAADAALVVYHNQGTDRIAGVPDLATLETTLAEYAASEGDNPAVLHFLIHLAEMNGHPERALGAAERLRVLALDDEVAHLLHMASHVFIYTGAYAKVRDDNQRAVRMDESYAGSIGIAPNRLDYYQHELEFWYGGAFLGGDEQARVSAAEALRKAVPYDEILPLVQAEQYAAAARVADAYGEQDVALHGPLPLKFYAGIAYLKSGRMESAQAISKALDAPRVSNAASARVYGAVLRAEIAAASGDEAQAESLYRGAATAGDRLSYESLPPWLLDVRGSWAAMELRRGRPAAAITLLTTDLARFPASVPVLRLLRSAYVAARDGAAAARVDGALAAAQRSS